MTVVASRHQQQYTLPAGGTLTITLEADRPLTEAELLLLARLARDVEGSQVMREREG